mgnify:CR=1 FL=1
MNGGSSGVPFTRSGTKKVAIGQLAMRGREDMVSLKPCGRGIVLETLRYEDEVRKAKTYFRDIEDAEPDGDDTRLWHGDLPHGDLEGSLREVVRSTCVIFEAAGAGIMLIDDGQVLHYVGATDAVFVASYEGGVYALDALSGGRLWSNDAFALS